MSRFRLIIKYFFSLGYIGELFDYRGLIKQLAKRQIQQRYKGSALGFIWAFIVPLAMLAIYTFIFGYVFKLRGGSITDSKAEFALTLFAGLIVFNVFSEGIGTAPNLIRVNTNYVKKVVFPIQVLPVVCYIDILIHGAVSLIILLIGLFLAMPSLSSTMYLFPLILIPLSMLTLGFSWFLAAIGVYAPDINQSVGVIVKVLFFLTPIFYPITAIPQRYQVFMKINPLAILVDSARRSLIWGKNFEWYWFLEVVLISFVIMQLGYTFFMITKKGFADVL